MNVIGKELRNIYCGKTLVGRDTIYIVEHLPNEGDYIDEEKHKGYVVSYDYDEEEKCYSIYLEKNKGDYDYQISDICDIMNVIVKEG